MSKGLGKLQAAILEELKRAGKPLWACEVAYRLYNTGDRYEEVPTRAFEASVNRAVHTLASRGLVQCDAVSPGRVWEEHSRLACWLPDMLPPEDRKSRLSGKQVEAIVMDLLTNEGPVTAQDSIERDVWRFDDYDLRKGLYPYHWLMAKVCKRLGTGGFVQGREAVAVHRAVKRLAERGEIRAYWKAAGRYGTVGLKEAVSVAV